MGTNQPFVLPGDQLESSLIPADSQKPLRLGPGLRYVLPEEVMSTVAGQLVGNRHKNLFKIETPDGRYTPRVGELIIGTVQKSAAEMYHVLLTPYTSPAILPQLSFESATKKTRPHLDSGSLVYARISLVNKHMDAELECVSSSTGKSDGLGPLTGGLVLEISLGMSRRLMMRPESNAMKESAAKVVILTELAAMGLQFETATGRNGRFWVRSESTRTAVIVGLAVKETDEKRLDPDKQKKLVRRLVHVTQ